MKNLLIAVFILTTISACGETGSNNDSNNQPSALCNDGTYSYSQNCSGTCSSHGGVAQWMGILSSCGGSPVIPAPTPAQNITVTNMHPSILYRSATSGYDTVYWFVNIPSGLNITKLTCKIYSPANVAIDSCTEMPVVLLSGINYQITMEKTIGTRLSDITGDYTIETIATDNHGNKITYPKTVTIR